MIEMSAPACRVPSQGPLLESVYSDILCSESSANSLVLDVMQSGRLLINNRKRRGPSTMP